MDDDIIYPLIQQNDGANPLVRPFGNAGRAAVKMAGCVVNAVLFVNQASVAIDDQGIMVLLLKLSLGGFADAGRTGKQNGGFVVEHTGGVQNKGAAFQE